jgi:hypothetical protein
MALFYSPSRLIRSHHETRTYITEIQYSRNHEPVRLFLFLSEYNTEIFVVVNKVIARKNRRSHGISLLLISIDQGDTALLVLDHRRGNHYILCKQPVFKKLTHAYQEVAVAKAPDSEYQNNIPLKKKIVFIDSQILAHHQHYVQELAANHNEIILFTYFYLELEKYLKGADLQRALAFVDTMRTMYPGQVFIDWVISPPSPSFGYADLSEESDYMIALAKEQPVTKSQIAFFVCDEGYAIKAQHNGFMTVIFPKSGPTARENELLPSTISDTPHHPFPPRSAKHRKREHSLSTFRSMVKMMFYIVL